MKFCTNCGTALNPGAKFCANCGKAIYVPPTAPADPTTPPAEPPSPAAGPTSQDAEPSFRAAEPTSQQQPDYQEQEPVIEQAKEAAQAFKEAVTGKTNLIQRVINILTKPKQEWHIISAEQPNTIKLIGGYALILALIPAISTFIRHGIIGYSVLGTTYHSLGSGIQVGIVQLLTAVIGVYLLAWVVDLLAPTFDSEKNFGRSLQLAVYSSTPQWVAGILLLLSPTMGMLVMLLALYAIYLLAAGMPVIKNTPKDKVVGYVVLVIVAMILISLVLALVLGAFLGLFFVGNVGGFRFSY